MRNTLPTHFDYVPRNTNPNLQLSKKPKPIINSEVESQFWKTRNELTEVLGLNRQIFGGNFSAKYKKKL